MLHTSYFRQRLGTIGLYLLLMAYPFGFVAQAGLFCGHPSSPSAKAGTKTTLVNKAKHPLDILMK